MSMRNVTLSLLAVAALILVAPSALAEEWPPNGWERFIIYSTGSCNCAEKTYNGHFEVSCDSESYQQGSRSGKWRAFYDTSCVGAELNDVYQVCVSGSSCSNTSGTWQTISYEDFAAGNCP